MFRLLYYTFYVIRTHVMSFNFNFFFLFVYLFMYLLCVFLHLSYISKIFFFPFSAKDYALKPVYNDTFIMSLL